MAVMIDYRTFPTISEGDKAVREAARMDGVTVYTMNDKDHKGWLCLKAAWRLAFKRKRVTSDVIQTLRYEDAALFYHIKLEHLKAIASCKGVRGVDWRKYKTTAWGTLFMNGGIEGKSRERYM